MAKEHADNAPLVIRSIHDVFDIVNRSGRGTRATHWLLIATMLSFSVEAYDIAGFAIAVPSLTSAFHLSPLQVGNLTSIVGIAAFIGAAVGGYFVDRIGRLKLFMVDMLCFFVAAIVGAFATNITTILIVRFLMGIGIGLDVPAAMTFVAEYTSGERKRPVTNKYIVWIYYLQVGAFFLGAFLLAMGAGQDLWRWIIGLGAVPSLAVIILRYMYMEESALWLACRGDFDQAAEILRRTLKVDIVVKAHPFTRRKLSYRRLFMKPFLKRTISCTSINFFQSLVYFSVLFYLPVVATQLFKEHYILALTGIGVIQIFGLLGGMTSSAFANKVGFRWETIIGYGAEIVLLLFLGITQGSLPALVGAALVAVFLFAHTFGPAQTGVSMSALSYPTELRGQGVGFSYGVGRLGAVVGFYLFPLILAAYGLGNTLLILAFVPLLGLITMLLISWDPTGVEAETTGIEP